MEIWKNINGFESYQVSNLGNIKSVKKGNEKILSINSRSRGYVNISLCVNSKNKTKTVHRLVAMAFIPNIENKPQVNHINGIKTDNRVENLEWCTAKENTNHALNNKLQIKHKGEKCFHFGKRGGETNRAKKVLDTSNGKIYDSLKDVVKDSIYSYKNLSRQLSGERKNKTKFIYTNSK